MFRTWLKKNSVSDYTFDKKMFPTASDRAFWNDKADETQIAGAEKFIGYDWPVIKATDFMAFKQTGDRMIMESPHFARRNALAMLVIAEVLEYKKRFIPDIVNGLFAICEETFWGLSAHWVEVYTPQNIPDPEIPYVDLFAGETAATIAWTYYLLYDELYEFCPEICDRVIYELNRRVIKPYLEHRDWWWMGYYQDVNNWTPWIVSNILSVFLIMVKDKSTMDRGIKKLMTEAQRFYDRYPADGGCDEGCSYWTQAGASLFEVVEQLFVATDGKINFYNDEKFRNMGKYEYKLHIGNGTFVNFADGATHLGSNVAGAMYLFGKRIEDKKLMQLAKIICINEKSTQKKESASSKREAEANSKLRRMLIKRIYQKEILAQCEEKDDGRYVLDDLQIAVLKKDKMFLAAKGGTNDEGHNHNDIGNFVLYDDVSPVLVDAGVGVYTRKTFSSERYTIWTMQSSWHNLPEVNGVMQHAGRNYFASAFGSDDDSVNVSFAKAYPDGVEKLDREIRLFEDGVDVTDRLEFDKEENTFTEYLLTCLKPEINGNEVILDGKYTVSCEGEITLDEQDVSGDGKLNASWKNGKLYRIGFKNGCGKQSEIKISLRRKV